MNLQTSNSRLFDQQVIDSNIDQLIRECPVPKVLYDHHVNSTRSNIVVPFSGHGNPTSISTVPGKHGYARSKGPRFELLNSSFHSSIADTSAADIFYSLKNQSMDDTLLDSSNRHGTSRKENNPVMANSVHNKHSYQHRHLKSHVERNFNPSNDNTSRWQSENRRHGYQDTHNLHNNDVIDRDPLVSPDVEARHPVQREVTCDGVSTMRDNFYEETFQDAFSTTGQNEDDNISTSTEVCSLYEWIIKPVPGTHDICVEGKKSLRDGNFWHSGVITRRVNEKVVETQTKSLYRLEGNMELLDAMAAGISRKTAEAFWLGFPRDWQQLVYDHFKTAPNIREEEDSESEEEITTLDECSDEQEEIVVTEIASIDEEEESIPTIHTVESDMNILKSPRDNTKTRSKKGSKSGKVIENWIIRPLPDKKGIYLVGVNDSGSLWHSSAIKKRLDKKRLMSHSGSIYKLKGNMDNLLSLNEGLPIEIIEKFKSGFPKEWQELVQEHLYTKQHKKKTAVSNNSKLSTSKKKEQVSSKIKKKQDMYTVNKKSEKKSEITTEKKTNNKVDRREKKSDVSLNRTPSLSSQKGLSQEDTYKRTKTFLTPSGESVDLENLGRSRSGRLIKPPLQWWTGQTLEIDGENVTVKAPTVGSSVYLQEFENGYKKSTRQVKPYWNPRQKYKDYSLNGSKLSLNSSASSVETKTKHQPQKQVLVKVSSKTDINSSLTEEDSDSKLKCEVKVILQNKQSKRKKVNKSSSSKLIDNESATDADNPSDMTGTTDLETTLTDQEVSDPNKIRKSKRKSAKGSNNSSKTVKETRRKSEQVNVVSSSTGDIGQESEVPGEDKGRRSLRSRNVKKPNLDTVSEGRNKEKGRDVTKTAEIVRNNLKNKNVGLEKDSKKKSDVNKLDEVEKGSLYRKRGKVLQIIEEETSDEDTDNISTEPVIRSGKKRNVITKLDDKVRNRSNLTESNKKSKASKALDCSEGNDDYWSIEEKDRLKDACKKVPPNNPHYWDKVAADVRTKTAEMCREMYYSDQRQIKSSEKKNKKIVKEKAKVTGLTANVGTLKRKLQLKDLLDQQNENYTDDIFDSTPFRKSRKRKVLVGNDDDAVFEELARKQGKTRFETPVGTDNMCSRITVPFASSKKTPVSNIDAEMLEKRGDPDAYVHKILKRRLLTRGKKKLATPKSVKKSKEEKSPQLKLFHNYLNEASNEDRENHEDSCHEEDYYWEDEVNT